LIYEKMVCAVLLMFGMAKGVAAAAKDEAAAEAKK